MIDDGPAYKLVLQRAVKRFDLELREWPWPPDRARGDRETYWRVRFEDTLFRVGLGVRKLIEAAKLSVEAQERPVAVTFVPAKGGRRPNAIDQHHIDRFYDLEAARPDRIPLLILCHAIVHSYVLLPRFDGSAVTRLQLKDFYLASDRGRVNGIYLVDWKTFVDEVVTPVTSDGVVGMVILRLPNGEDFRFSTSSSIDSPDSRDRLMERHAALSKGNAEGMRKFMSDWRRGYGALSDPLERGAS
ncbi:hypothetical protein [Streptomyces cyaneofuscatus]|uniref:hypothetical protein n=1 Tax=Streptomyces cyaneofuscatus TaxID=66883 RepID=UPI0038193E39